jgi:hypothetical protein
MGSIRSEGRHQTDLLPETIDAYIGMPLWSRSLSSRSA